MNNNVLKDIGLLAAFEIAGFLLLLIGVQSQYSPVARLVPGIGASWAFPLVLFGTLLLCAGIAQAIKLIIASTKSGSDSKSESNNTQ